MQKYNIPVSFTMVGEYVVEANSLTEALEIIKTMPLPIEDAYVDDSCNPEYDYLQENYPDEDFWNNN